jgi:quercetin dioxygenase-like cupin family protein
MNSSESDETADLIELAAIDAAGALDRESRAALLVGLATASDEERRAIAEIYEAAAAAAIATITPADAQATLAPSRATKTRLMERLDTRGRFFSIRSTEGEWQTMMAGVESKLLSLDRERQIATILVRFAAGVVYPSHHHSGAEECYVISGDLIVQGQHLHAGDFHHAGPGSDHEPLTSVTGGEALLVIAVADYPGA